MQCDPRARAAHRFFLEQVRRPRQRPFTALDVCAATGYPAEQVERFLRRQWYWFVASTIRPGFHRVRDVFETVPLISFARLCSGGPAPYPETSDDPDFPRALLPPRLDLARPEPVGAGVFGTVYRCVDRKTGRHSAVKVTNPEVYAHSVGARRLEAEVQAARRLGEHEGLVYQLDRGRQQEPFFVEMEWVAGRSLEETLHAQDALPQRAVAWLGEQLAATLAHAHERGVVHRDLKPANVLLADDGRAVIIDFGLALFLESGQELPDSVRRSGTKAYAAPEVARGAPGRSSDMFALGALLFESSTGQCPPVGFLRKPADAPPDPREFEPDLDEDLALCIRDLLEYDRKTRPTAAVCAERLAQVREDLTLGF